MFQYQKAQRYFAQIAGGLEETGQGELEALGVSNVSKAYRGLYFNADPATLYRVNYRSRLITRVLAPLITFDCHSDTYLYNTAREIDWSAFLTTQSTFAVFATVHQSKINHSKFAALRLKDAIVDVFRERTGKRPSIDRHNPDVWFNVHIDHNKAVISIDTSGGSLHRRGYRVASVKAPMQETVAAAVIRFSGWDGTHPFYDPFCGSGTLLCEALMHYANIPASYLRESMGFERLPDFQPILWKEEKSNADAAIRSVPEGLLRSSDRDPEAVFSARQNAERLPHGDRASVQTLDFRSIDQLEGVSIICNPPYGLRLQRGNQMGAFYKALGDFFKQRCKGSTAYVYFGNREWIKHIGLRPSWKKPLTNGQLDGRLVKYEMY